MSEENIPWRFFVISLKIPLFLINIHAGSLICTLAKSTTGRPLIKMSYFGQLNGHSLPSLMHIQLWSICITITVDIL